MKSVESAAKDLGIGEAKKVPRDTKAMGMKLYVVGGPGWSPTGFQVTGDVIEYGQELADVANVSVRAERE